RGGGGGDREEGRRGTSLLTHRSDDAVPHAESFCWTWGADDLKSWLVVYVPVPEYHPNPTFANEKNASVGLSAGYYRAGCPRLSTKSNMDGSIGSSNFPASFDVTALVAALGRAENAPRADSMRRVKLLELEPHRRRPSPKAVGGHLTRQPSTDDNTRLFLAVAFGKRAVAAQLVALELESIRDEDDDADEGEGGLDGSEPELEWVDVSDERLLPAEGSRQDPLGIGAGGPVVVFPPSSAQPLPTSIDIDTNLPNRCNCPESGDGAFEAEITSCALIPSPAVKIFPSAPNASSELMTKRTVAVMLGTAHDEVLSLLLDVSQTSKNPEEPRFALSYNKCRPIENRSIDQISVDDSQYPVVHRILPCEMIYGDEEVDGGSEADGDDIHRFGEPNSSFDEHVDVFWPSLQTSPPSKADRNEEAKYSGIKSISFRRDNSNPSDLGPRARSEVDSPEVAMSHDVIWITYGNGTLVKFPSWKPFLTGRGSGVLSVVKDGSHMPCNGSTVIPLSNAFQSPLEVPPEPTVRHEHIVSQRNDNSDQYWKLLSTAVTRHSSEKRKQHALVLAVPGAPASSLPVSFNSSGIKSEPSPASAYEGAAASSEYGSTMEHSAEDSHERGSSPMDLTYNDDHYGPATGTVVEGTAALVKGAFGMAMGAVRWGLGGSNGAADGHEHSDEDTPLDDFMETGETPDGNAVDQDSFKAGGQVKDLFPWPLTGAAFPFCDTPRRFDTAVVDPSGTVAVTTDNLGRIVLFDLETNQPTRIIKGMRNTSCSFAELALPDGHGKSQTYLVIHLRQRGALEVHRLQQGPRVSALAVPPQKDCMVIECHGPTSEGSRVGSFLLERVRTSDESNGEDSRFIIDKLVIDDLEMASTLSNQPSERTSQSENKIHLQLLMQILAPDTNIQATEQTVLATFKSVRALTDLGEGLAALSKSSRLGSDMGINGSRLHSQAVSYCKSRLNHAKEMESQEGSGMMTKRAISELTIKLAYHERLDRAYDVLHRYESKGIFNSTGREHDDIAQMENLSPWASEALSWISMVSGNDVLKTRFRPTFPSTFGQDDSKPVEFSQFALSCQPSNHDNDRVYLTKIKRSRAPTLNRIFRPLLQDLFVFKVVNTLFFHLGINEDFDIQQQYFGEWSSSLPLNELIKLNLAGTWRPMKRWLHDLILSAYDYGINQQGQDVDDALKKTTMLESLLKFCADMEDLPKAFLLAVICMDSVSSASLQLEQKTYGRITQLESIGPWENLLRKLRVCLLVSFRLSGEIDSLGAGDPMTVSSVSRSDIFSVFHWIARDELTLSHENQVLLALESACLSSSEYFYPSAAEADHAQNTETIFRSCRHRGSSLQPTGLTDEANSRPLLFYLKDHAPFSSHLAANRALTLASMWGKAPEHLHLLKHALSALQNVVDRVQIFSLATVVEIYQAQIRPVCRAMLFGFGGHELSEEVVSPLIQDGTWSQGFIACAKRILTMIIECDNKVPPANPIDSLASGDLWPPLRECSVLNILATKHREVQLSSVELHHTVMFAFEMTHTVNSLKSIVPSFGNLFLVGTIYCELPPMPRGSTQQKSLLDKAIVNHAENTNRPVVDNFADLLDLELFAKSLGITANFVRTHYLIEMIRLGKDASIDDLLGASGSSLEKSTFAEQVVRIICARLHATVTSLKKTKNYRGILSLLDADASRWVREEASKCPPSQRKKHAMASLITTHSMVMRIKNMFSGSIDESISAKIDALCLMSETLLKAVQTQEEEAVMSV
ncbi:hypothetical protein ACHAWF_014247, partial [Thalassiosira exigua]